MAVTSGGDGESGRAGRRPPGELEAEVLAVLRAAGRMVSPAEVYAAVGERLAYTTVTTILHRLHRKGLAVRQRHGRGFAYAPAQDEVTHTANAMHTLLRQGTDRAAVFARFLHDLSPEDERLLQQVVRDAEDHNAEDEER
jgi:predicted transcriptional regulator